MSLSGAWRQVLWQCPLAHQLGLWDYFANNLLSSTLAWSSQQPVRFAAPPALSGPSSRTGLDGNMKEQKACSGGGQQ